MHDSRTDLRVSSGVPKHFAFARGDLSVFDSGFDLRDHFVFCDRQKLFLACERIANRLLCDQSERRNQRLELGVKFRAIAAAEIRNAHANAIHGNAEGVGELGPDVGRGLTRSPDIDPLALIQIDERDVRLHRHMLCRRRAERIFEDAVGRSETLGKVGDWLQAGTRLVWVIDPERRTARIYRADGSQTSVTEAVELSGEEVLPGFACPLSSLL